LQWLRQFPFRMNRLQDLEPRLPLCLPLNSVQHSVHTRLFPGRRPTLWTSEPAGSGSVSSPCRDPAHRLAKTIEAP
jgi:hypothetical protein